MMILKTIIVVMVLAIASVAQTTGGGQSGNSSGGGTVTSVTAGNCLTGGTITATGTIALSLSGSTNATLEDNGVGCFSEIASPIVNGLYSYVKNVTGSAAVAGTWVLSGVPVSTPATPYPLASTDRATYLRLTGGSTFALTLCQITGTCANNLPFVVSNFNSSTLTFTANAADKVNNSATGGTLPVLSNYAVWMYQDSSSAPGNWWPIRVPMFEAFSGFTGILQNAAGVFSAATGHNISGPLACAAASASGTAYTCSTSQTFVPSDGDVIFFQADVASGAAPTLVVNGQSGSPLIRKNGGGASLVANDLIAGQDVWLEFDGTNWQEQYPGLAVFSASSIIATPTFQGLLNTTPVNVCSGICSTGANGLGPALLLNAEDVTGTGSASVGGTAILRGGIASNATPNAAALAGPAQVAAGALKGSAIANVGDVICGTTTAETVTDCPLGANNVVGIATTTAAPVTYVSNGVTVVKTDNATTIGDVICGPSVTAGLAHDNGTSPCPPGAYIGTVMQNAGTNAVAIASGLSTATATPASTLPLVQLAIGSSGIGQLSKVSAASQTAAISTATLCTAAICSVAGAQYNLHWNMWGSGTACSSVTAGSVTFLLTWTDENAVTHSAVALQMMGQTGAATEAMGSTFPFQTALANESASGDFKFSTNGTIIQYGTGYTACTTGTGTYGLRASITRVQ